MRVDEINGLLNEQIQQRIKEVKEKIHNMYLANANIYDAKLLSVIEDIFKEWKECRGNADIFYIDIWSTRLSVVTNTYEYTIRVYDEGYYYDNEYVEYIWASDLNAQFIEEDKLWFTREINTKLIRAKKYDVKDFLYKYIYETYIKPMPKELGCIEAKVAELKKLYGMDSDLIISYGEMMEKSEIEMKC